MHIYIYMLNCSYSFVIQHSYETWSNYLKAFSFTLPRRAAGKRVLLSPGTARVYVESFWSFIRWHKFWFPVLKHGDFPVRQQSPTVKFPKGNIPIVSPIYGISHEKNTTHSILTMFPLPSHFLYPLLSGYELHLIFQPFLLKSFFNLQEILHFFLNKGTIFLSRPYFPGAKLMALKFLDGTGGGRTSDAVKSMNYAVAMGAQTPGLHRGRFSRKKWGRFWTFQYIQWIIYGYMDYMAYILSIYSMAL